MHGMKNYEVSVSVVIGDRLETVSSQLSPRTEDGTTVH
jgi:hypothetical protein